jgi:hypothetical protein
MAQQHQAQVTDVAARLAERSAALAAAEAGQFNLLAGKLAATITSAVKAAFIPDMASQHIEVAKTVLVSDVMCDVV